MASVQLALCLSLLIAVTATRAATDSYSWADTTGSSESGYNPANQSSKWAAPRQNARQGILGIPLELLVPVGVVSKNYFLNFDAVFLTNTQYFIVVWFY